jgi:TRAP-type C4-dicarboxylate transport system substrate-binding protein
MKKETDRQRGVRNFEIKGGLVTYSRLSDNFSELSKLGAPFFFWNFSHALQPSP